jgi:hypothetical protein
MTKKQIRLEGNFPGGQVDLTNRFTLRGDLIVGLEIVPTAVTPERGLGFASGPDRGLVSSRVWRRGRGDAAGIGPTGPARAARVFPAAPVYPWRYLVGVPVALLNDSQFVRNDDPDQAW